MHLAIRKRFETKTTKYILFNRHSLRRRRDNLSSLVFTFCSHVRKTTSTKRHCYHWQGFFLCNIHSILLVQSSGASHESNHYSTHKQVPTFVDVMWCRRANAHFFQANKCVAVNFDFRSIGSLRKNKALNARVEREKREGKVCFLLFHNLPFLLSRLYQNQTWRPAKPDYHKC